MNQTENVINLGETQIKVDYKEVEECNKLFEAILIRINTILMNNLNMNECHGEMADALRGQYKCLQDVLEQMGELTENINNAVKQATQIFKETDEGIASSIRK